MLALRLGRKLFTQRAPRAEDERLDRRNGKIERLGDLCVGEAADLAEDEDGAIVGPQAF